jgi:ligand-binding SRPBCC domain-containing protein
MSSNRKVIHVSHIQCIKLIAAPRFKVFEFMTSPDKISEQMSGMVQVEWQNPGTELSAGSELLFVMSRHGVEQPIRFVVERIVTGISISIRQIQGVFTRYIHTIKWEDHGNGSTLVTDIVEYNLPFGLLGRMADDFYFRRDIQKILEHRLNKVYTHFGEKSELKTAETLGEDPNDTVAHTEK